MNLNSKEFMEHKSNSFSELPDGTTERGKRSNWQPISNPELNYFTQSFNEYLSPYREYLPILAAVYGYSDGEFSIYYHAMIDEVCINLNGRWWGYFDEHFVNQLLTMAIERNLLDRNDFLKGRLNKKGAESAPFSFKLEHKRLMLQP